jgi:hypothetical protein
MRSFEYVVIFIADMEKALEGLGGLGKKTFGHEYSRGIHDFRSFASAVVTRGLLSDPCRMH